MSSSNLVRFSFSAKQSSSSKRKTGKEASAPVTLSKVKRFKFSASSQEPLDVMKDIFVDSSYAVGMHPANTVRSRESGTSCDIGMPSASVTKQDDPFSPSCYTVGLLSTPTVRSRDSGTSYADFSMPSASMSGLDDPFPQSFFKECQPGIASPHVPVPISLKFLNSAV